MTDINGNNSVSLTDFIKLSILNWKLFVGFSLLFGVLFFLYAYFSVKEYQSEAVISMKLDKKIETSYGVFKPMNTRTTDYAKLFRNLEIIEKTIFATDYDIAPADFNSNLNLTISEANETSIKISLKSEHEGVGKLLAEHISNFKSLVNEQFNEEAYSRYSYDLTKKLEFAGQEMERLENEIQRMEEKFTPSSFKNLSKEQLKQIRNMGFSVDVLDYFGIQRRNYDEKLFNMKTTHLKRGVEKEMLTRRISDYKNSSSDELFKKYNFVNQFVVLFSAPTEPSSPINVDLKKRVLLGVFLGLFIGLLIVFFRAIGNKE